MAEPQYKDAVAALNTLQSNFATVNAIRKSGNGMNKNAIPEMIEWCRRAGYEPEDFDKLRPIHIAGTKGKGSTSAFIASILAQYLPSAADEAVGPHKIGLYTSPHLRFVRERIQIDESPLSETVFARYFFSMWDRLETSARVAGLPTDASAKPAYFRFLTLMAMHAYLEEGVDTVVMEAGIGGEYDSTNILIRPTVTGITSLAIDHVAMLGSTVEEIAWHKAGIMKPGAMAFTVPQPEGAMRVLRERAREKDVRLEVVERHPDLANIRLGLAADFQKTNASLAIAVAAAHLRVLGRTDVPEDLMTSPLPAEFRRGLEQVRLSGRCETRIEGNISWCIDGGHTLESIEVAGRWFADKLKTPDIRGRIRVLIFNQQTRDAIGLARALHSVLAEALGDEKPFTHVIFCSNVTFQAGGYKADLVSMNSDDRDVEELRVQKGLAATWAELEGSGDSAGHADVRVLQTIEEAVRAVRDLASKRGGGETMALATGSLHLVGGLLEVLESGKEHGMA
ncbi:MAG: Folylpolyglutamate synthetase [Thelocarpon impressellum]|nr:MAG: Folylpolyglutamate synthetase [Thelocarpon impressellum]